VSEPKSTSIEIGGERLEVPARVPLLPVRNTVVFPGVTLPLSVGRAASLAAVQSAAKSGGFLTVATQRAPETESPRLADLYPVATLTKIVHLAETGSGISVAVVGLARVKLTALHDAEGFAEVEYEVLPDLLDRTPEAEAARRTVQRLAKELVALRDDLPDEAAQILDRFDDPARLADVIAYNGTMPIAEKIELLAQQDVLARLRALMRFLMREIRIAQVSKTFAERAAGEIGEDERRKLLREQLRKIRAELGESDEQGSEGDELLERLENAELPSEAREVAEREVNRLAGMPTHSPERSVARTYVEWLLDLPWKTQTDDNLDLAHARRILDEDHFDLEKVKERILEYLAVRKLVTDPKGPILCFLGPPGVGKTSLGKSIARAMGRKFVRASLGGVRDEAEIRGHRRTYVGALPGRIVQNLKTAGTRNPVFILDEIDKVGMDYRGDPSSALLEVLDPEQNSTFSDHYIEVPFDLSKVLFIATANRADTIPPPLLDRMEIIELPGYTASEKVRIGREFLLPRQLAEHGIPGHAVTLSDEVLLRIVEGYTREAGVRSLERNIASLVRKSALRIAEGQSAGAIEPDALPKLLGPARFAREEVERRPRPGVATGMVWTPVGGDLVFVESARMDGKPELHLTGMMGDVMRESAEAALSYVRTNAESLHIAADAFEKSRIHVHVPAGGQPKDGPSAGVTMVVSLASLLTGKPVRDDVAMTGEITLRGQVLPVGGIKGKVLAAHRAGIKELILPKRNAKDLEEVPPDVLGAFKIVLVDQASEAVREAIPGIG
jgi:ATP-dependent Lon protease